MIRFYNFKKLFLLLFLLIPTAVGAMEKGKKEEDTFQLVVSPEDKDKCRILHKLLDGYHSDFVPTSNAKTLKELKKVLAIYNKLGMKVLRHKDFVIYDFQGKRRVSIEKSSPDGFLRWIEKEFPYEQVYLVLGKKIAKKIVNKACRKLPFKAEVYTNEELLSFQTKWAVERYESIGKDLITVDDNDNDSI